MIMDKLCLYFISYYTKKWNENEILPGCYVYNKKHTPDGFIRAVQDKTISFNKVLFSQALSTDYTLIFKGLEHMTNYNENNYIKLLTIC